MKKLRKSAKLSREQLAELTGVSVHTIVKIEQGKRNPSIGLAKKLADILGTNVDSLFFGDDRHNASGTLAQKVK